MSSSRKSRGGFTLVELMVAMAVTVLLLGILTQILSTALGRWNRSVDQSHRDQIDRVLTEVLVGDLRSMVYNARSDVPVASLDVLNQGGLTFTRLTCLAPIFDQNIDDPGDVHSVYWHVLPHASRDGSNLALYRDVREADDTFTTPDLTLAGWVAPTAVDLPESLVVEGISAFQIDLEVVDSAGSTTIVTPDLQPEIYGQDAKVSWGATAPPTDHWLVAFHVRAEVLTRHGRAIFDGGANPTGLRDEDRYPYSIRIPTTLGALP